MPTTAFTTPPAGIPLHQAPRGARPTSASVAPAAGCHYHKLYMFHARRPLLLPRLVGRSSRP